MPSIEKIPIYDVYCIFRRQYCQYQRLLNILFFGDVSVAQLVASMSGVVLGGVVMVVGSNVKTLHLNRLASIYKIMQTKNANEKLS